ncbi:MAG: hypothetical protein RL757_318 [Bacteroidota bacterium]|jgi:peptidoglycan/LPS O-acetylase OafA/YrhL
MNQLIKIPAPSVSAATTKIYFPGLNALRFFAAFLVVMHHAESVRLKRGMPHLEELSLFKNGGLAVLFFFALSGFLITYLLLAEIQKTKTVSVRNFYVRRVLRIWPVYYLLVIFGLFVLPVVLKLVHYQYDATYDLPTATILYLIFQSFTVTAMYGASFLQPLWSIGVEEYFYLIWAPLVKLFRKNVMLLLLLVIAVKLALSLWFLWSKNDSETFKLMGTINGMLSFEAMAIGGIGAWFVFFYRQNVINSFLFGKTSQIVLTILILSRLFIHESLKHYLPFYNDLYNTPILPTYLESVLFLWLIINISCNPKRLYSLDGKLFNFLGDISYGIYMYQMVILFAVILALKGLVSFCGLFLGSVIYYTVIIIALISLSTISKEFFEDYFLRLKKRFEKV